MTAQHARRQQTPTVAYILALLVLGAAVLAVGWSMLPRSQPPYVPPANLLPVPTMTITVTPPEPPVTRTTYRPGPTAPPLRLTSHYCLLPPYPGEAHPGAKGPVALGWQKILIAAGMIPNRPQNLDGWFGPATTASLADLQRSWGWTPGPADQRTYHKLTELMC